MVSCCLLRLFFVGGESSHLLIKTKADRDCFGILGDTHGNPWCCWDYTPPTQTINQIINQWLFAAGRREPNDTWDLEIFLINKMQLQINTDR